MAIKQIDGQKLSQMFVFGATNLEKYVKVVDALNVFPVPDGDTGTNMNLSITSGVKEVKRRNYDSASMVATTFAKGLLMGARGNSGVILSQLFRGFSQGIEGKAVIKAADIAEAFQSSVATAYKAVMKPVEGTILTVAKDAAKQAKKSAKKHDDLVLVMEEIVAEARASLKRTPDLLPVLKEVGVVDSGGQGLVYIYEGFLSSLKGEELSGEPIVELPSMEELVKVEHHHAGSFMATEDIEFGFCTEVMVRLEQDKLQENPYDEADFRNELNDLGDSLLVVSDDDYVKVHVHVEQPGEVLTKAQRYGELIAIKIENMREQHSRLLDETDAKPPKENAMKEKSEFGIVTVSMGDGMAKLFKGLGAGSVIAGGQTMNPSTEDIVKAIKEVHANQIIILPNNSNIIMAAEQAAEIADEKVIVVPSKTIPQGVAALLAFNPAIELADNAVTMNEAMAEVKSGQVTFAVRDTTIDQMSIKKDDYMGIAEKDIVSTGRDLITVTKELCEKLLDHESEIVTLFQGEGATDQDTSNLVDLLEQEYPDVEFEIHQGNQPLYSYIISVE